jgi:hypothetical protein
MMLIMSATPEDLKREAEEEKIRAKGLTCKVCRAAIANQEDFESYTRTDAMCTECMYKTSDDK